MWEKYVSRRRERKGNVLENPLTAILTFSFRELVPVQKRSGKGEKTRNPLLAYAFNDLSSVEDASF